MSCSLHKVHWPLPLTVERHHVIPRAWQLHWRPARIHDVGLWRLETVELCPSSHRNVHFWIVRFMHSAPGDELPRVRRPSREQRIALRALSDWLDAGGSLDDLRAAGLWGEA